MNLYRKAKYQLEFLVKFVDKIPDLGYSFADIFSHINIWNENGPNVFALSNYLVEAFRNTDIPQDVSPADFRYPHNSFLIENDNGLFEVNDPLNVRHKVKAILCNLRESFGNEPIGLLKDGKVINGNASDLQWKIMMIGIYFTKPHKDIGINEFVESLCLPLGDNQKICEIDRDDRRVLHFKLDIEDVRNITNIVFNTVAYLSDPNRNIEDTQEVRRRSFRISPGKGKEAFEEQRYVFLRPPKRYIAIGDGRTVRSLDKRFWVRGHWRWQSCGKNFSERRHTWILPFVKGPVEGGRISRTYVIEKEGI